MIVRKLALRQRLKCVLASLLLTTFSAGTLAAEDKPIVFKAVSAVPGDPSRVMLEAFKDALELYTDYAVRVEIYDAGTFGDQVESARGVRKGVPDFSFPATNNLASLSPSFGGVLALPYLIESEDQIRNMYNDPIWEKLTGKLEEESGIKALGQSMLGYRWIINSKKPVESAEDLKGLKIRVPPVPQYVAAFESWGVPPTPIPWNETPGALQQGVIDGLDNPANVILAFKFYEQAKYITKLNFSLMTATLIMGKENFEKQPEHIQQAILLAAKDAQDWQYRTYTNLLDANIKSLEEHGVTISSLTDEDFFKTQAQGTWAGLAERSGGQEWVDEVHNAISALK